LWFRFFRCCCPFCNYGKNGIVQDIKYLGFNLYERI
jgi:hypothetical protein